MLHTLLRPGPGKLKKTYFRRILVVESSIAVLWGEPFVTEKQAGIDTLFKATAFGHGLTMATRDTRDVADTGVSIYNPWQTL